MITDKKKVLICKELGEDKKTGKTRQGTPGEKNTVRG